MTLFTNVVEGEFCELRVDGVLRSSYVACSSSSGPKSCVCFTAHVCYVYTKPSCWIEAEKLAPILGCLGRVEPVAQPATTANGGGRFCFADWWRCTSWQNTRWSNCASRPACSRPWASLSSPPTLRERFSTGTGPRKRPTDGPQGRRWGAGQGQGNNSGASTDHREHPCAAHRAPSVGVLAP